MVWSWKADLIDATRKQAVYMGVALVNWATPIVATI